MHILKINDDQGQTQAWWFNFLYSLRADTINNEYNLQEEFSKWGAILDASDEAYCDAIAFKNEADLTWFLLQWS
jgi:hypothetical protein